jgi:hypothetical protein
MTVKTFLLFPQEDDDILALDNPEVAKDMIKTAVKLRQIIRQSCRVGNVFLLPTTFLMSHVGWATWLPTTFLMRKVGKKRTLPTLHDCVGLRFFAAKSNPTYLTYCGFNLSQET